MAPPKGPSFGVMTKKARVRLGKDERRAQLVGLGIRAFTEKPYDAVNLDLLAVEAGVSKALVYHYFPTKRDFYLAVLEEGASELLELTRPDDALDPAERLVAGIDAYLRYVDTHDAAYVALFRSGLGVDAVASATVDRTRAALLERLVDGLTRPLKGPAPFPDLLDARGELQPFARLLLHGWIGFVEASSLVWAEKKDVPREDLRQAFVRLLFHTVETASR